MYEARFLNTSTGRSFRFGFPYGTVFDIDPLDGVGVDISTSQGFQQVGVTVEGKSVGGTQRQIKGQIIGPANIVKRDMMQVFSPMASGKLFFNEKYYCDAVVKTTPSFGAGRRDVPFVVELYCPVAYWYDVSEHGYIVGGYTPAFRFPVNYAKPHRFGIRNPSAFINCYNGGVAALPYTATFTALADVENYGIVNAVTLQELKINDTLHTGERTVVRRDNGRLIVEKTIDGVTTDIFSALDEDSNLMTMQPGNNPVKVMADSGADSLVVSVAFSDAFAGVYDGM